MRDDTNIRNLMPQPGDHERRMAALSHASIASYLLGIAIGPFYVCAIFPFIPFIILVYYWKRNKWVSFHALQAIIFQLILFIVFLFIGLPSFFFAFQACAPGFGQNTSSCKELGLPLIVLTIITLFVVPMGMMIFGCARGIRILCRKDIEYPIISSLVRKWLKMQQD